MTNGDALTTDGRRPVPWRTIWATIASVSLAFVAAQTFTHVTRVLSWVLIAAFLAVVLNPIVDFFTVRLRMRRGLATSIVMLLALASVVGIAFVFVQPLVTQGQEAVDEAPAFVERIKRGEGPIGELVVRYQLEERFNENEEQIRASFSRLGEQSMTVLGAVGNAIAGTVTVLALTFLMLLDGPKLLGKASEVLPGRWRHRVRKVAADCGKAVTGFMFGNLLISVVAGITTYIFLRIAGVPFALILAVFVAVMDMVPLIGATLGAVVVIIVAFLVSPGVGVAAIAFFVIYQQIENYALHPAIQAKTVKLSPLGVMVSLLIAVELAGMLGALLAVPAAAVIKVIARDVWDHHDWKDEPTVGADEIPVSHASDEADEVPPPEAEAAAADAAEAPDRDENVAVDLRHPPAEHVR